MRFNLNELYIMPYVEDEYGNHIIDDNGSKMEYTVTYGTEVISYVHREPIYVNDDGHLDTEDRHLVIKDGINNDHAVSKQQLDTLEQNTKNAIITAINRDDDQNH